MAGEAAPEAARAAVLARLAVLSARSERLSVHLRGRDGRIGADFGDVANYTAQDEVLEGLDEAARAEAADLLSALRRMDAGTFGACEACGRPIPAARLAALPAAQTCVACAAAAEAGR